MGRVSNIEAVLRCRARKKHKAVIERQSKTISTNQPEGRYVQRLVKEYKYVIQLTIE